MAVQKEREIGLLGRLPAKRPVGLHQIAYYQQHPLPAPPVSVGTPNVQDWLMLGNDRYGDCTFAGAYHAKMATAKINNIDIKLSTDKQVIDEYLKYTHGQDAGAVESDLLKYWHDTGIFGSKIDAYAPTDHHDFLELKSVINAFGLVYIGIDVPAPCQQQFAQHKPWTLTHTIQDDHIMGGHCIILTGYDNKMFYGITWGAVQAISYDWLKKYMMESWAIITPEIVQAGHLKTFRLADLQADIKGLHG